MITPTREMYKKCVKELGALTIDIQELHTNTGQDLLKASEILDLIIAVALIIRKQTKGI